jgi:hypothetical protein
MEYFLIFILQLIGIGLSVGQKVYELDKKFADDTFSEVLATFWKSDRMTVWISLIILCLNIVAHYIIEHDSQLPSSIPNYPLYAFGIAFILGYAGQRIIYKWLGTAEKTLTEKGDKIIGG